MTQATTRKEQARAAVDETQELTDGFRLVIDALKLNGLTTIYGVPGIPITDFGRLAQAAGIRVLSFRHEQSAGYAAAIAGFLTKRPGVCLTVSAPGFLNGLTALAHATTNCFPMILISGSSEREIVDLQQGDYEEMDQLAIASRCARRRSACCMPPTSASALRARSARPSRDGQAASISTCRPSCSARS
jgi:oxalyl-CoA decarboxylase